MGKFFFGSEYENYVDTEFSINLWARWGFLLLLFHPSTTIILGPPKYQKFLYFSSFCQIWENFVNSGWMKKNKSKINRNTIKSNYQTHNTKLLNLHREGKKKEMCNKSEISDKKMGIIGKNEIFVKIIEIWINVFSFFLSLSFLAFRFFFRKGTNCELYTVNIKYRIENCGDGDGTQQNGLKSTNTLHR